MVAEMPRYVDENPIFSTARELFREAGVDLNVVARDTLRIETFGSASVRVTAELSVMVPLDEFVRRVTDHTNGDRDA